MAARPPSNGDTADGSSLGLMIRLLKLGSFINTPMKEAVCDPADVTPTELKVMMALAGEGALAGHDLVGIMGMPPMNVSRAIATLKERGWVQDAHDPENRRRRPVALTMEGEDAYRAIEGQIDALASSLLAGVGKRQAQAFSATADTVIDALAEWTSSNHAEMRIRR